MFVDITVFDPNYWIFSLGLALNRYEEYNAEMTEFRVRKEFEIGLLILTIKISFCFNKPMPSEDDYDEDEPDDHRVEDKWNK
jgi:hypothetical protein